MKLRSLRLKGIKPFQGEQFVNFDAMPGRLIALIGSNGAGKSSLLGLFPGCLYRKVPGRGNLANLANTRDSRVECHVEIGEKSYSIVQRIDAFNGKSETSLMDGQGKALLSSGKVTEYDKWAAEHVLSPEVFFGSVFSSQRTRGMLGMDPAARKSVILKVLGLDRYEKLSKLASEHKREAEKTLAVASGRLQELTSEYADAYCETQILKYEAEQRTADETLRLGTITVTDLRTKNEAAHKAKAEYDALAKQRQLVLNERLRIEGEIVLITAKIRAEEGIIAEADKIRDAKKDTAAYAESLAALREQKSDLLVTQSGVNGEWKQARGREETLREKLRALQQSVQNADAVLARKAAILESANLAEKYDQEATVRLQEIDTCENALEAAQTLAMDGKGKRIVALRSDLHSISEMEGAAENAPSYARGSLDSDEGFAKTIETVPAEIERLKSDRTVLFAGLRKLTGMRDDCRKDAAHLPEIESAEKTKAEAEGQITAVERSLEQEHVAVGGLGVRLSDITDSITSKSVTMETVQREIARLVPLVAKADSLKDAQTRIKGYEEQKSSLGHRLLGIEIPPIPETPPAVLDLSPYETAIREAQNTLNNVSAQLAVWKEALIRATATQLRRTELQAEIAAHGQDAADWKRLADDLGLKGVPGLLVDASGPELTELANDLLRSSGDSRFALRVNTTPLDAKGNEREGCEIEIIDQRDGSIKTGASGGEEVFIDEALSQSLTAMAVRHAGIKSPTLVRDESGAALDPAYGAAYIAMLRRTAEILDAQVLYVSHNPDLQSLADAVVRISEGTISVE